MWQSLTRASSFPAARLRRGRYGRAAPFPLSGVFSTSPEVAPASSQPHTSSLPTREHDNGHAVLALTKTLVASQRLVRQPLLPHFLPPTCIAPMTSPPLALDKNHADLSEDDSPSLEQPENDNPGIDWPNEIESVGATVMTIETLEESPVQILMEEEGGAETAMAVEELEESPLERLVVEERGAETTTTIEALKESPLDMLMAEQEGEPTMHVSESELVPTTPSNSVDQSREFRTKFVKAVHERRYSAAMSIISAAKEANLTDGLPRDDLLNLFKALIWRRDPCNAYIALEMCVERLGDTQRDKILYYSMYRSLCRSFRRFDMKVQRLHQIELSVRKLMQTVQSFPPEEQQSCFQLLLSSLLEQPLPFLGKFSPFIYDYMVESKFQVQPSYLEHLLALSRYNRQDDLPFAEIFATVVLRGRRPSPTSVTKTVENHFPFTNLKCVRLLLKGLVALESSEEKEKDENRYIIDTSLLESIAAAISRVGDEEAIRFLWEYLEASGVEPTEGLYESTAVTFCHDPERYANAFAVMDEMQSRASYKPSRALMRSMSRYIRQNVRNFEKAFQIVMDDVDSYVVASEEEKDSQGFPLAALNTVLSAAARRSELDVTVHIMHTIEESNLPMDVDTFVFAFECLGRFLFRRCGNEGKTKDLGKMRAYVMARAMEYLDMMDSRNLPMTHDVIKEYVDLLVVAGDIRTATQVVVDALERGAVGNKVIHRVAVANAEVGNFKLARSLAQRGTEKMPWLVSKIEKMAGETRTE